MKRNVYLKKRKGMQSESILKVLCLFLMLIFYYPNLSAQDRQIEGIVIDAKSEEPLIGASIVVKSTRKGAITNEKGEFSIYAPIDSPLIISYIGYQSQEIKLNGKTSLLIKLKEDSELLNEVVVVGYGSIKKKDVTTSVAIVSLEDINDRPITSAVQAIQGKAAGVQVIQPSGEPGKGLTVRVRGNTSISASNAPLYVVDGTPMDNLNNLSPTDIESMQILKDASSAAIYGSRGANGVVLITTKRGEKGDTKIMFNSYIGMSRIAKKIESLNTAQYYDLMSDLNISLPEGLKDETDWFDEIFQTGINQSYQLSFSGGSEKTNYFVSGGYIKEQGIIKTTSYNRYNFRVNLESAIRPWLKLSTNLSYSDDNGKGGIISGTGANRGGVILSVINTPKYALIWDPENPARYYENFYGANITHPVENRDRTANDKNKSNRFVGRGNAEFIFNPDFKFKTSLSFDRLYTNKTTWIDPFASQTGRDQRGFASDERYLATILTFDDVLTYDKKLKDHQISAMGGTSYTTSHWDKSYLAATNFLSSEIKTINAGNKVDPNSGSTQASEWVLMSYLARIAYNYKGNYLLTMNMRADGSSKLSPSKRWGYFPSLSAGWRISGEPFMNKVSCIDDLKIRAGWGKTGNQSGISDYSYLETNSITRQNWWESGKANANVILTPTSIRNKDLTWETTTQTNIGIDLSMFKNRLRLNVDAYYKHTTNMLMNIELPAHLPIRNIYRNEGEMENKGFEFTLVSDNLKGAFNWSSQLNISINRNKLKKLTLADVYYYAKSQGTESVVRLAVGEPVGKFWGYISDGVDPQTGDIVYRDIDGNGKITPSDKTYIGDPNPDFTFGFSNDFEYKNFALNLFFTGSVGNDIYNASRIEMEGMYGMNNQSISVLRRWKTPGQITDMPRAVSGNDNLKASSRWIEDGSYLRLKNITLSYQFNKKLIRKLGISKIQPYITAQNLITFTRYKGFDPEVNQWGDNAVVQGIDWGTYPQSKTFIFGVNIEL